MELLERWGPDRCEPMDEAAAARWCHRLTLTHAENFSVLSGLMPEAMRPGACALYAFCRWSDDLADESKSPERALALLDWWRGELHECFQGRATHPVFLALRTHIDTCALDQRWFDDLIDAFVQDQRVSRYDTHDELFAYCRRSADPVGRLVLGLGGVAPSTEMAELSDRVCTGLQLVNHWQDVRRDLLERDRIYIPADMHDIDSFEERLRQTCTMGHAPDTTFLEAYRQLVMALCARARPLLESVEALVESAPQPLRPMLWLFGAGGLSVLEGIEQCRYETVLFRPRVSKWRKFRLLMKARRMAP